jgi:hypothetical protein
MCKKNDWDVPVLEKPDPASLANIVQKEQKSKDTKKKWRNRGILAGLACMVVLAVTRYETILKKSGIDWSFKSMKDADVMTANGQTVMALLVGAIRADRFSEGTLLSFFENGSIRKWLIRLQEIDNTNT